MPYNRNQRVPGARVDANRAFGQLAVGQLGLPQPHNLDSTFCCVPPSCDRMHEDPIKISEPGEAVRVICNNEQCMEGQWMHKDCFDAWETHVLSFLRTCGRARSWSEKQRMQNLWTKKGYDLAYKACDCKCGRGHIRKDLDYEAQKLENDKKPRKGKKRMDTAPRPNPGMLAKVNVAAAATLAQAAAIARPTPTPHPNKAQQLRVRTGSFGSTGSSSPPSSASISGSPPPFCSSSGGSADSQKMATRFDFFADAEQAAHGNIFKRRTDFSVFNRLPRHQQNPYHIKMEDEGPHGNDEIRCFILTNLSTHQITQVPCVVCSSHLYVYDRYPLIDGTFFLSPLRYNSDVQVLSEGRMQYLNAICLHCLATELHCRSCKQCWTGSPLIIGTMYAYDIFAAVPCCGRRLTCKHCSRLIMDPGACAFQFYSDYSRTIQCPHCHVQDYHFVKPLDQVFMKPQIRW